MKKIFRMALVFALAGATLVYTGCTKDYAEEIDDLNSELAKTQDELKSVKEALAKAEALAEAAATKSELNSQVSTLNTAITKLSEAIHGEGGIDDEIDDLWEAVQAIDEKIEEEGGLRDAIDEAKAAIAAIFNQIQSVVFVPEYVGEGIPFAVWTLDNIKTKPTAITTFKVTPAAKATEVGTKYKAAVNVAPLKSRTRTVEAPDHSDKVSVISADPATGYVQVAIEIGTTYDHFAVSLELKEAESKTEIVSDYVPAIAIDDVNLLGLLKLTSATAESWREIFNIKYDDDTKHPFFDTFSPKFVFNDTEYTREQIAKAFPGLGLTWADTVKVVCSEAEAFAISDTTANFPAKVQLAKAKTDSAFNYVDETAKATYTVKFSTTASLLSVKPVELGEQTALIVKSFNDKPIVTAPVVIAWNYETWNGTEFADNSLPVAEGEVEWVANDEKSDFVDVDLFGTVSAADFAKADGNVDSLRKYAYETGFPCTYVAGGSLKYKNATNVDLTLTKNGVWPAKDTTYYEVYGYEKNNTKFALAIPITIKAKPADKVFTYAADIVKTTKDFTLEAAFDSIYTEAFANKLVDELAGKTAEKETAKAALIDSLHNKDVNIEFAKINSANASSFNAEWNADDIDIEFAPAVKYSDEVTASFYNTAFGVKFTFKVALTTEDEPGYEFGFINDPRLTTVGEKSAIAYAALTEEGIPEVAYMNQFVRVVRPVGVKTSIFNRDALKVKFNVIRPANDTLKLNTASVGPKNNFAQTDEYSVQSSWSETADTTLAYIGAPESQGAILWNDCIADTIPVQAILYCDEVAIDTVIVKVYTDDPFAGENVFKGFDFAFDASDRNNASVTMGDLHIYDSVTVKSNLAVFANTNFVCPNFYEQHSSALGDHTGYAGCRVDGTTGVVSGSCEGSLRPSQYHSTQNFYAQYNSATGAWKASAANLNLGLKIAPVSEWTYGNGYAVEDNLTNLDPDFENGQITLLKGNKLTEDLVITIPIKLTYRYSQKPLTSQVTVTFTK